MHNDVNQTRLGLNPYYSIPCELTIAWPSIVHKSMSRHPSLPSETQDTSSEYNIDESRLGLSIQCFTCLSTVPRPQRDLLTLPIYRCRTPNTLSLAALNDRRSLKVVYLFEHNSRYIYNEIHI